MKMPMHRGLGPHSRGTDRKHPRAGLARVSVDLRARRGRNVLLLGRSRERHLVRLPQQQPSSGPVAFAPPGHPQQLRARGDQEKRRWRRSSSAAGCSTVAAKRRPRDQTVVVQDGVITYVGPTASAPAQSKGDVVLDYSGLFVMPGLIDVHTHLAYGNAKSEENIDLYSPMEFRALRGMFFAQQVLAAGYTSICSPGDAGRISLSIRNAVDAGLFPGPRVMAAGPYITSRQGLADWYPTWIGTPETGVGHLVKSLDEGIEEVRRQVKEGVDCIKIAMDGRMKRADGEFMAAFTPARDRAPSSRRSIGSAARRSSMRAAAKRSCTRRAPAWT